MMTWMIMMMMMTVAVPVVVVVVVVMRSFRLVPLRACGDGDDGGVGGNDSRCRSIDGDEGDDGAWP